MPPPFFKNIIMCDLNIIGISNNDSECFAADENENLSEIYLTDLDGFNLQTLADHESCQYGNWREHCEAAISESFNILNSDVRRKLQLNKALEKDKKVKGTIGYGKSQGKLSTSMPHLVYRLVLKNRKNQVVKISGIGLFFENASDLTLNVYNSFGSIVKTMTLEPLAGNYYVQTADITLSADVEGLAYVEYFFVVDVSANKPYSLKHVCCGDNYTFSYKYPCFNYYNNGWRSIMMVGYDFRDFDISDISTIQNQTPTYKSFAGLTFVVENATTDTLCDAGIDYADSDIGIAIALALRCRAAMKIYTDILNRPNVDLVNPENTVKIMQMWADKYNDYLDFITSKEILKIFGGYTEREKILKVGQRL